MLNLSIFDRQSRLLVTVSIRRLSEYDFNRNVRAPLHSMVKLIQGVAYFHCKTILPNCKPGHVNVFTYQFMTKGPFHFVPAIPCESGDCQNPSIIEDTTGEQRE